MKTLKKLHFYLNSKIISFNDIIEGKKFYVSEEELLVIEFCRKWIAGAKSFIFQTSGSTGTPKQITLTRKQMEASAKATISYLSLNTNQTVFTNQTAFICINTNYIGGIMMIVRALMANMLMVIVAPTANPLKDNHLELIPEIFSTKTRFNIHLNFAAFVPLQLQKILTEKNPLGRIGNINNKLILDNMKAILVGGASLSETQENLFKTISAPVYQTYGMTETASHIALRRINPPENLNSNYNYPINDLPKNDLYNDYFEILPNVKTFIDERGCLVITAPSTNFEEVITNDLVEFMHQNNTKYLRFLGRIDNIINSGGVKVQLEKVEKAIEIFLLNTEEQFKKYANKAFYCMGLPDETLGQRLVVVFEGIILPKELEKSLFEYLAKNLSKYEIPKEIIYKDTFERTETGKIIRK